MFPTLGLLLGLFGATSSANAEEASQYYLQPVGFVHPGDEAEPLNELHDVYIRVFPDAYDADVALRVFIPWFPDAVVGLRQSPQGFRLFRMATPHSVSSYWYAESLRRGTSPDIVHLNPDEVPAVIEGALADLPADMREVEKMHCEVAIDDATADKLIATWSGMLERAEPGGVDPKHFDNLRFEMGERAAIARYFSAVEGSPAKQMIQIALNMNLACKTAEFFLDAQVSSLGSELEALAALVRE